MKRRTHANPRPAQSHTLIKWKHIRLGDAVYVARPDDVVKRMIDWAHYHTRFTFRAEMITPTLQRITRVA